MTDRPTDAPKEPTSTDRPTSAPDGGTTSQGRALATALGQVGAWSFELDKQRASESIDVARRVEAAGFRALWIPESVTSREVFAHAAVLLAATTRLIVATGIANIHARDSV